MSTHADLYDTDFYAWTQEQAALLEAHDFAAWDIPHLVEEILSTGASEPRELYHRLIVLLTHLLKLQVAAQSLPYAYARAQRRWRMRLLRHGGTDGQRWTKKPGHVWCAR